MEFAHIHPAVIIIVLMAAAWIPLKRKGKKAKVMSTSKRGNRYDLYSAIYGVFVSNILGYGGGPASIPLIQKEVVDRYHWLTVKEFSEMLAIGNALPGPIATKWRDLSDISRQGF